MSKTNTSTAHKIMTIIGIVLCVILVPILIINLTLIAKSYINKDEVPSVGGMMPLIVLTDSMYPEIKSGDLVICQTADAEDIKVGDIISFFDPAGNGTSVVTHQVIERIEEGGKLTFRTKGTNNNTEDRLPVSAEDIVGIWTGVRFGGAGSVALFMQTTAGLIVCVVVPIILLVGYDLIRRRKYEKEKGDDMAVLLAELEELKRMQNAERRTQNEESEAEATEDDKSDEA